MENNGFQNPWATSPWMPGGTEFEKWAAPISNLDDNFQMNNLSAQEEPGIFIMDNEKLFKWKRKYVYTGKNQPVKFTIIALNHVFETAVEEIQTGYGFINWNGINGHVLFDLVNPNGKLKHVNLTIMPMGGNREMSTISLGSHFDDIGHKENGFSTLWFNPWHAMEYGQEQQLNKRDPTIKGPLQLPGKHSPITVLMHELTHVWMRNINKKQAELAADALNDFNDSYLEMEAIKVENIAARVHGEQGRRVYYQGDTIKSYTSISPFSTKRAS